MTTSFDLNIPNPCQENWNAMIPNSNGRFCGSCAKSVVDFTNMNNSEIQNYFASHQNERICGRFEIDQLSAVVLQIPARIMHSQISFRKIFLLALLAAMGTTLFSCTDKSGKKQKIDKVEIVNDSTQIHSTLGLALPARTQTVDTSAQTKPEVKKVSISAKKHIDPLQSKYIMTGDVVVSPVNDSVESAPVINPNKIPKTTTSEK